MKNIILILTIVGVLLCILTTHFTGAVSYVVPLKKVTKSSFYRKVGDVRIHSEPEGRKTSVTLLGDQNIGVLSVSLIEGKTYDYVKSFIFDEYYPRPSRTMHDIYFFPGEVLKDGDRSVLWERVTTYMVQDHPDLEYTTGYFVGQLPLGEEERSRPRIMGSSSASLIHNSHQSEVVDSSTQANSTQSQ